VCKSLSKKQTSKGEVAHSSKIISVLIVEDELIIAMDLRNILESLGCRICASTANGEESIHLASECRPDLVLMDIRLKGKIDGIQAASTIQSRANIPIIYLSAYGDEETMKQALKVAVSHFIRKPFSETEIINKIESVLGGIKKYPYTN